MKRSKRLLFLLSSLLLLGACAPIGSESGYQSITMDEAASRMKKETDYIILDVRTAEEFAEGHIPHAINVANEEIGTDPIPALPEKGQLIFVYCRSGRRSKEAAQKLTAMGCTRIIEFGGILDWQGEIER